MEYLKINLEYKSSKDNIVIALGNFDGMHLGHRKLIDELNSVKLKRNLKTAVLLFENHSKNVVLKKEFPRIMSFSDKIDTLTELSIDYIFSIEFDDKFRNLTSKEFLEFLTDNLRVSHIVVGEDYTFGVDRGKVNVISNFTDNNGISLSIVPSLKYDGYKISSRNIIKDIENGNLKPVNFLLGRYYSLKGNVESGFRRGHKLGYPTANLKLSFNYVIPKDGVYFTKTKYRNKYYFSFTSVGNNPTFNNKNVSIETHIFDFDKEIYDEEIEIFFIERFRDNEKFDSVEKLKEQLSLDREKCNELIKTYSD